MKLRGGWPLMIFAVLLVAVPILEVWLLIAVSHQIGGWPLIAILVADVVLGAWLMRREGSRAWRALNGAFTTGRVPAGELADAALILVGGVLLMVPGFATDVLGLAFLLPITRPLARRVVAFFVARRITKLGGEALLRRHAPMDGEGTVIVGETVPGETVPGETVPGETVPGQTADPPRDSDEPRAKLPKTEPMVISGEVTEGPTHPPGRSI